MIDVCIEYRNTDIVLTKQTHGILYNMVAAYTTQQTIIFSINFYFGNVELF